MSSIHDPFLAIIEIDPIPLRNRLKVYTAAHELLVRYLVRAQKSYYSNHLYLIRAPRPHTLKLAH